jgi:putative SOS response-associated peptidase YedK
MTHRYFRRAISWDALAAETGVIAPPGVGSPEAEMNIAPTMPAMVIRASRPGFYIGDYAQFGRAMVQPAFWGLVPTWWTGGLGERPFMAFNAPAEKVQSSRAFDGAFMHGRCLVPASGFFVWSGPRGAATPFVVSLRSRDWFCFAGLWTRVLIEGSEIDTFAIITCEANAALAGVSERMPVILDARWHQRWLDLAGRDPAGLLNPWPTSDMRVEPGQPGMKAPEVDEPEA